MAAIDPNGTEKYWFDGLTFKNERLHVARARSERYWFDGLPVTFMTPDNNQDTGRGFTQFMG